jgi:DNA-directed RNA polymerase specialized sigma24 family protein
MRKEWVLTQDAFDDLLNWLGADREQAAQKYETIRLRLIKIFTCRGCSEAEDLADETINRVMAKVSELISTYSGDPALYFYGVAQKVHLEYRRKTQAHQAQLPDSYSGSVDTFTELDENAGAEYQCLERCLERLPVTNRDLVIRYYQQEKRAKIDQRKRLAHELGIAVNALRIRAHRIRLALQECVERCLEQQPVH